MDIPLHTTSGYLLKKGGGRSRAGEGKLRSKLHRRNWSKRWFVLDVESGELQYYKDASMQQYKGTIRILTTSSIQVPDAVCLRGRHRPSRQEALCYFELHQVTDDEGRMRSRPLAVRAPSGEELIEWLRALQKSLDLQRQEENTWHVQQSRVNIGTTPQKYPRRMSDSDSRTWTNGTTIEHRRASEPSEPILEDWSSSESDDIDEANEENEFIPPAPPMAPLSAGGEHMKELEYFILRRKHANSAEDMKQNDQDATTKILRETNVIPTPINKYATTRVALPVPIPPRKDQISQGNIESQNKEYISLSPSQEEQHFAVSPSQRRRPKPPPEPKTRVPPPLPAQSMALHNLVSPLSKRDVAIHDLAMACSGNDADAIAVAIAHAVHEAGVPAEHASVIRAREKLDFLEQPTDHKAAKLKNIQDQLRTASDPISLGSAIRASVAFGINPDSDPLVLEAQARLLELLVQDKEQRAQEHTNSPGYPEGSRRRSSRKQILSPPSSPPSSPPLKETSINNPAKFQLKSF
uniref:PH domain-containing protein n=1 Tax=Aureoumbra lagunensis TaxID=44058 RepID=A0A7S3JWS8_9STRA|mmetsp:Transcript_3751/g.5719  ORF Transcript_3751/g.5719 Transcript_3751/m.5719 type:complete len:522 (+) Transcript_3751:37-1602(+)